MRVRVTVIIYNNNKNTTYVREVVRTRKRGRCRVYWLYTRRADTVFVLYLSRFLLRVSPVVPRRRAPCASHGTPRA